MNFDHYGIRVVIRNIEEYQHYDGDKTSRIIKRQEKDISIGGVEYSDSFLEVISFLISVLRVFLQNKMGKIAHTCDVVPDYEKRRGLAPCENAIVASRNKDETGDQVLILEVFDIRGQKRYSQELNLRACMQVEIILTRFFSLVTPDHPMTGKQIDEAIEYDAWSKMSDVQQKSLINDYIEKNGKTESFADIGKVKIPNKIIKLIDGNSDDDPEDDMG